MIPEFLGRLHPLVLHIPIGVYVLLFLLQYVFRRLEGRDDIIHAILLTGAAGTLLAASLGWLLSLEGDHAGDTLEWHRWLGVAFSVSSILLAVIHLLVARGQWPRRAYGAAFALNLGLMTAAGHYGGNLTHGEGYLLPGTVGETVREEGPVDSNAVFHAWVMPVLQRRCVSCHNAGKTKGGLRMDDYARLLKGGKNGPVIVPGDPLRSEMLRRIHLPADEEKHMPPVKKPQLTAAETALLQWWVLHGASKHSRIPADAAQNDTLNAFVTSNTVPDSIPAADILPQVRIPDSSAMVALRANGWSVRPVAQGSSLLDVSVINMDKLTDADLKLLLPIADNILWLDLAGMPVTDEGMAVVGRCTHLRRLSLKGTQVGTDGLRKLAGLAELQSLNLVQTPVDDAALAVFAEMRGLVRIYAWQTRISAPAVQRFTSSHPRIRLATGFNVTP